jgi:hypothetical protein
VFRHSETSPPTTVQSKNVWVPVMVEPGHRAHDVCRGGLGMPVMVDLLSSLRFPNVLACRSATAPISLATALLCSSHRPEGPVPRQR